MLVQGITFKENVADIRNSKVADLIKELMQYSVAVHIHDPHASANEVAHEYNLTLVDQVSNDYDAVIIAVNHDEYQAYDAAYYQRISKDDPIVMDLKGMYAPMGAPVQYWRL